VVPVCVRAFSFTLASAGGTHLQDGDSFLPLKLDLERKVIDALCACLQVGRLEEQHHPLWFLEFIGCYVGSLGRVQPPHW
jgi:hypothetical protein